MRRFSFFSRLLAVAALAAGTVLWTGCDSNDSSMESDDLRRVSYELTAQDNDGSLPGGVNATATFWEVNNNQTLVTLELDDGATGASVSHPAHIHNSGDGSIAIYLSPIDGSGGGGTSARVVNRSFDELSDFSGYINIHESVDSLGNVVSQGNIGSNAEGTSGEGLDLADELRATSYSLSANANEGAVAPDGLPGEVVFQEVTSALTLVTLRLDAGGGATGASVSHPAHIHNNTASEGGSIAIYLSPIDGSDSAAQSSKLVERPYDELTSFDGYVNVHESVANLGNIVSQGNIGANAEGGSGSDGGSGDDDGGGGY